MRASPSARRRTISSRVCGSAVAVSAMRGTAGKALVQQRELQVFRAEVVAPLRNAVRLVDGEQRDLRFFQQLEHARHRQALGRDVEQVEFAGLQGALRFLYLFAAQSRIQKCGADTELLQRRHLVLHQRDQRRDHQRGARPQQRRQSGSRATCRRRWASAPARRRPRRGARRSPPGAPRKAGKPKTVFSRPQRGASHLRQSPCSLLAEVSPARFRSRSRRARPACSALPTAVRRETPACRRPCGTRRAR